MGKIFENIFILMFPTIALVLVGWFGFNYFSKLGPKVTLEFSDAVGIEENKTKVLFRGVNVGSVSTVNLAPDGETVRVVLQLKKTAIPLNVEGSKFSLVTPSLNFKGVNGLETLIKGTYISVIPGPPEGSLQYQFGGSRNSLKVGSLDGTSTYFLLKERVDSIDVGDRVQFRGLTVGKVTNIQLRQGATGFKIQINVEDQYAMLIRQNSFFWVKSGFQADLGLFGSDIKMDSLESLFYGQIELATPDQALGKANNFAEFRLFDKAPEGAKEWNPNL